MEIQSWTLIEAVAGEGPGGGRRGSRRRAVRAAATERLLTFGATFLNFQKKVIAGGSPTRPPTTDFSGLYIILVHSSKVRILLTSRIGKIVPVGFLVS